MFNIRSPHILFSLATGSIHSDTNPAPQLNRRQMPDSPLYNTIARHLKTSRSNKTSFLTSLTHLLSSRKPSILFDFCCATPTQLTRIVEESGLEGRVKVVKLLEDVVLVDTQHDFLANYSPVFVDCSRRLGEPVLAAKEVVEEYRKVFTRMVEVVASSSSTLIDLDVLCGGDLCLTTVFGMFLRYPYLYYTSDEGNCLSGVELVVVELGLNPEELGVSKQSHVTASHVFTSFSVPKALLSGEKELERLEYYVGHRTVCLDCVAM